MKTLLLSTMLLVLILQNSAGQSTFGLKAGANFSNLAVHNDQIEDSNTKSGFTIGIVHKNRFETIGIQSELLYIRKGAEYEIGDTKVDANLDYLELPVTLQLRLFNSPISVYAGGNESFLLNAKYEYPTSGEDLFVYDDKDSYNKFDYGVLAGLSSDLGPLLIDARFSRGLRNVEHQDRTINSQVFSANDTKIFGFQITGGILFSILTD